MKIIADENIPAALDAFRQFGDVITLPGRSLHADDVRDADILLVRSVTRVNEQLLAGSDIRYIGSATIGTDHIDLEWCKQQGIRVTNAPACNAISAAEYVLRGIFHYIEKYDRDATDLTVGIIGCGNVGSRVQVRVEASGFNTLICDPPRAEREAIDHFVAMEDIAAADIITVHVPLVKQGPYQTTGMINQSFIQAMKPDCLFINTSRGDVIEEQYLRDKHEQHEKFCSILDVWNGEPNIDGRSVDNAEIATPHIAGYSIDGKLRATHMLYQDLCGFLSMEETWSPHYLLPEPKEPVITPTQSSDSVQLVSECLAHVYDIARDDRDLRETMTLPKDERGAAFDRLRKHYPTRRECSAYSVTLNDNDESLAMVLRAFGFNLV